MDPSERSEGLRKVIDPLKEKKEVLEAPFLGRTVNAIIKKFEGIKSLNARRKLGED